MSVLGMKVKDGQGESVTSLIVLVDSDNPNDFERIDVRNAVIKYAALNGLSNAIGLGGSTGSYPVDDKGETSEELIRGTKKFSHFQAEYQVNARF